MKHVAAITVFILGLLSSGAAQIVNDNCADAAFLCPDVQRTDNNIGSTTECPGAEGNCLAAGTWLSCYNATRSDWFYFETNATGGNAVVTISGINCLGNGIMQAIVLQAGAVCDPSTYTQIACDANAGGNNTITMFSGAFAPSTRYYVHVNSTNPGTSVGCQYSIEVTGGGVENQTSMAPTNASCPNATDGMATATPQFGSAPYTYAWSSSSTTQTATGLAPGTYTVTVTDDNGCTDTETVTIGSNGGVTGIAVTPVNPDCGTPNGRITIDNISGGTSPITFAWSNGGSTGANTSLGAGTYSITITDANGCTFDSSFTLAEPPKPTATTSTLDASCGNSDGVISVDGSTGGTPAYEYSVGGVNFQAANAFTGLAAGTYLVVIKDANNCKDSLSATINEPEKPTGNVTPTNQDCGQSGGSISFDGVSGGTPPYQYSIGVLPQTDPNFPNQPVGVYQTEIVDSKGCKDTSTVAIVDICPPDDPVVPEGFTPNGDGTNDIWIIQNATNVADFNLAVYDRWGQAVYRNKDATKNWDGSSIGGKVVTGTYWWTLKYTKGGDGQQQQGIVVVMY